MIVAAGAGLLMFLTVLILARQDIAKALPFMETSYNTFGLTIRHYGEGLSFVKVRSELRYDSGIMKLVVTGEIRNDTRYMQKFPIFWPRRWAPTARPSKAGRLTRQRLQWRPVARSLSNPRLTRREAPPSPNINLSLIEKQA